MSNDQVKATAKDYKKMWNDMIRSVRIIKTLDPMIAVNNSNPEFDNELNLANPYSLVSCFILRLYSMENFGSPPFYACLNKAVKSMDKSQIENLGPFQKAFTEITEVSENWREDDDKIMTGK